MIEVSNLVKTYGDRFALNDLSFKINKGEVVGLLGPNGAGKSTTMKIITGFMSPTSGQAKVCGFDVFENPMEVKKRIGYLPENPPLYLDMTIDEYLKYVAQLKKVDASQMAKYIETSLEKTQLHSVRNRIINNLSKGFKQRVGIAQALVSNPEVLVLDEPTVGLDPKQVSEIRDLINQLKGEHTIILSTHILSEVQATCSKIIIIHKGSLVLEDALENLQQHKQGNTEVKITLRHEIQLIPEISQIEGVISVSQLMPKTYVCKIQNSSKITNQIINCIIKNDGEIVELSTRENNLEEVFLRLTYESTI